MIQYTPNLKEALPLVPLVQANGGTGGHDGKTNGGGGIRGAEEEVGLW